VCFTAAAQYRVWLCACEDLSDAMSRRPHIVLALSDDHGWGDVGYRGHSVFDTAKSNESGISAMAANGLRFERFYAACICSPTRAAVLTGRLGERGQVADFGMPLNLHERTVAQALAQAGYATAHVGKWHLDGLRLDGGPIHGRASHGPGRFGFQKWWSVSGQFDVPGVTFGRDASASGSPNLLQVVLPANKQRLSAARKQANELKEQMAALKGAKEAGEINGTAYALALEDLRREQQAAEAKTENHSDGRFEYVSGETSDVLVNTALDFIGQHARAGQPTFTCIWYSSPHMPWVSLLNRTELDEANDHAVVPRYKAEYYHEVLALDRSIGTLRRGLRALDIERNTLLWFNGDNGGEPGRWSIDPNGGLRGHKKTLFEGGIRVPAVLEWPGVVTAGRVTWYPAAVVDIFPTIAEIVGLPQSSMLQPQDGRSLVHLFKGPLDRRRDKALVFARFEAFAVIDNELKLVMLHQMGAVATGLAFHNLPWHHVYNLSRRGFESSSEEQFDEGHTFRDKAVVKGHYNHLPRSLRLTKIMGCENPLGRNGTRESPCRVRGDWLDNLAPAIETLSSEERLHLQSEQRTLRRLRELTIELARSLKRSVEGKDYAPGQRCEGQPHQSAWTSWFNVRKLYGPYLHSIAATPPWHMTSGTIMRYERELLLKSAECWPDSTICGGWDVSPPVCNLTGSTLFPCCGQSR
jgi:arylsulfatase A-like enzyme